MPFIKAAAPHQLAARKFLETWDAAQAKRERRFTITFVTCVLLAVAVGTVITLAVGLRLPS